MPTVWWGVSVRNLAALARPATSRTARICWRAGNRVAARTVAGASGVVLRTEHCRLPAEPPYRGDTLGRGANSGERGCAEEFRRRARRRQPVDIPTTRS